MNELIGTGDIPLLVRRGGRDIKKNIAKPPLMERTGWSICQNVSECGFASCLTTRSAPVRTLRDIFLLAAPDSTPRLQFRAAEQPDGILFENQWSDILADGNFLKVSEPSFGRDEWKIRSEKHLVLEQSVRVLN